MNIKQIIIGGILCVPFLTNAQDLRCPPIDAKGEGKQKIDITAGAGLTLLYGDINARNNMSYGFVLKGDYKVYKGLYAGIEVQAGRLSATGQTMYPEQSDWDPRYVRNSYFAGSVNLTAYPYRFFVNEKNLFRRSNFEQFVLNGIYVGIGFGGISNNYRDIERNTFYEYEVNGELRERTIPVGLVNGPHTMELIYDNDGNVVLDPVTGQPEYATNYLTKSRDRLFPVFNIGYALPLNKYYTRTRGYFSAVVNAQFTFSKGEDLDGYDPVLPDRSRPENASNDMYSFIWLGLRYSF